MPDVIYVYFSEHAREIQITFVKNSPGTILYLLQMQIAQINFLDKKDGFDGERRLVEKKMRVIL